MRRLTFILALCTAAAAQAQSWEKIIAPGLSYRMEVDTRTPRVVHALRLSRGAVGLKAAAEVAHQRLYSGTEVTSREEMSQLTKDTGAAAGINGDFFGESGEPLGAMVRNGELISRPFPGRVSFGWSPTWCGTGLLSWSGSVYFDSIGSQVLYGINEDVPKDHFILFTDASATARAQLPCSYAVIVPERQGWGPTGIVRGRVVQVIKNQESIVIAKGQAVIAAEGSAAEKLNTIRNGDSAAITMKTDGFDWSRVDNVISGGPYVVKDGREYIDFQSASFPQSFADARHPRTAIGKTADGDIWWVVVDGRQPMSVGASLKELARIMTDLGCTDAINLDGGGSSTLSIYGEVLNRPSDGRERKVSNGVLFYGPPVERTGDAFVIQGPASLKPGQNQPYQLIGPDGKPVPDREVLWSAMGAGGWVDQSGTLRAIAAGPVLVRAYVRGTVVTLSVKVAK